MNNEQELIGKLTVGDELTATLSISGAPLKMGPQGPTGNVGPKGDKGDKGDQGERGEQGIQGVVGPTGSVGEQGPKGDKGDQGIQGPKGDKGDKGDKGEQGAVGPTGASASDSTEIIDIPYRTLPVDKDYYYLAQNIGVKNILLNYDSVIYQLLSVSQGTAYFQSTRRLVDGSWENKWCVVNSNSPTSVSVWS